MPIRLLPKNVVDRIAAGEVVERPSSVAKELIENSLDAGATRIDLALEEGGRTLIRVVDNGSGIEEADLPLAFASHATSKIQDPEELFHVVSLGFRGEALSSIAAVSRVRIRSRVPGRDEAMEAASLAGDVEDPRPASGPEGTLVEVRDLFFNTPVRRRFLRSVRSETGQVADWLTRLALSRPDVAFRMTSDGRETLHAPADESLARRIGRIFGGEIAEKLLPVEGVSGSMQLQGFVLPPEVDRPNTRFIHLFVNGRFVRDKTWLASLREAFRGLLMRGRSPMAFLYLTLDPAEVDVNVHPTKEEVRFREASRLFSLTVRSVKEALGRVDLRPRMEEGRPKVSSYSPSGVVDTRKGVGKVRERGSHSYGNGAGKTWPEAARPVFENPAAPTDAMAEARQSGIAVPDRGSLDLTGPVEGGRIEQFLNAYLFQETQDGLAITDQHALHERVLFEEIKARLEKGPLAVQRLLVPEVVRVSPREMALLQESREELKTLGLLVETQGTGRVVVEGVPEVMHSINPEDWLRDVMAHLEREAPAEGIDILTDELVAMMACRAAIKAGDVLAREDIRSLLEQGEAVEKSPFCPHGRPVTIHITRAELDRWFRR